MQLSQIVAIIRRNLWVVVACAVVAAALAFAFSKTRPHEYTANAAIAIEADSIGVPELQGAVRSADPVDPMPLVLTEMQALMSRQVVEPVIHKLGMESLPEFNPTLQPPSLMHGLMQRVLPFLSRLAPSTPTADTSRQAVLDKVYKSLVVSQDNRSLAIGLSFTSENPKLSADFVNDLIASYLSSRSERRAALNRDANTEMLQRVDAVRTDLNKLEQQMRAIRTKDGLVGLRAGSVPQQQVEVLATEASNDSLARAQLQSQWEQATALAKAGAWDDLGSVLSSPTISKLREQESQAAQHVADLQTEQGPNSPELRGAEAADQSARFQVAAEGRRIVASLAAQLAVARGQEVEAQRQLQSAQGASVTSENSQAELGDLEQEVTAQRTLYQGLLQAMQTTTAQTTAAAVNLDVRVLNAASQPVVPSSPNTKLATLMGGAGGVVLGLLLCLIRTQTADMVVTMEDAVAATGLSIGAVIRGSGKSLLSRVRANPVGGDAEALRLLRMRLRLTGRPAAPRSVMFVSLDDGREAADVASAFAHLASMDGEKIILAEGSLREPRLARLFGTQHTGLLTVLDGEEDWRDALLNDPMSQLDVLITRRPAAMPHTLLKSARFQNLLLDLHDAYNLTVFNGAAAASSDTLALAAEVNATVLIVDAEKVSRTLVREVASRLASASRRRVTVLFVLNR